MGEQSDVHLHNRQCLSVHPGASVLFEAEFYGDLANIRRIKATTIVPKTLALKVGIPVRLMSSITDDKFIICPRDPSQVVLAGAIGRLMGFETLENFKKNQWKDAEFDNLPSLPLQFPMDGRQRFPVVVFPCFPLVIPALVNLCDRRTFQDVHQKVVALVERRTMEALYYGTPTSTVMRQVSSS